MVRQVVGTKRRCDMSKGVFELLFGSGSFGSAGEDAAEADERRRAIRDGARADVGEDGEAAACSASPYDTYASSNTVGKEALWRQVPSGHGHGHTSGSSLADYAKHTGNIGPEGLGWQRAPDLTALTTEQLVATRAYARSAETDSVDDIVRDCSELIRRYGFCVVDHVVPREEVEVFSHNS